MERKKRVLITDDDPAMQDAFSLIFKRAGYDVTVFEYPDALLDGTAPVPDIYILDKQLSGVDGLDVCRYLKNQPETAQVPIIIVSATPHMARLAKEACADGFLEKPFQPRELLEMVAQLLAGDALP